MTLDARARRAAHDFRRALGDLDRADPQSSSFERFDRFQQRRRRNQRVSAAFLAAVFSVAALALAVRALGTSRSEPANPPAPTGLIVFNETFIRNGSDFMESFTVSPDGSDSDPGWARRDHCVRWERRRVVP